MLSLPSKHAFKALLVLSDFERGEFLTVEELAREADLPQPYLTKLLKELAKRKIVITKKGRGGGVALPPRPVSAFDVAEALGDSVVDEHCFLSRDSCSRSSPCPLHQQWVKERKRMQTFLMNLKI
ncbi:MAG: Rrf2 family transcriptional regulator [Bdellovibrionales bacterium]|nr:Rrf2 family transcriptional regulator [Bdellovibrionales bacterium]